ncbi:MAG: hypothetical protein RLZZ392_290, partial [Pseudomonadota bacterium]
KVEQITIDKDGKFSTKEFNKNS